MARNWAAASEIEATGISTGSSQTLAAHIAGLGGPGAMSSRPCRHSTAPSSRSSSATKPSAARYAVRVLTVLRSHSGLGAPRRICQTSAMALDQEIAELARAITRARRALVFTGAGISTESGIPDFRSPGGIWTRMAPIDFSDFLTSEEARRETWRRRFAMEETFRAAAPNRGHRSVAELVRRGK